VNLPDTPVEYLKTIGPQRAEALKKEAGIFLCSDMLTYYPFRYVDRTKFQTIGEINDELPYVQIRGKIDSLEVAGHKKNPRLVARFIDPTGMLELVWFRGINWIAGKLQTGKEYIVFGKPTGYLGKYNIAHPEIEEAVTARPMSAFQPVYPSSEKLKSKGLDSEGIRRAMDHLFSQLKETEIAETQGEEIRERYKLIPRYHALRGIHFPRNND
jgi:ATP-dependent DNA helicase RecG